MTRHEVAVRVPALLLAAMLVSCGIRGRPLAPLIIVPAVVSDFSAVRLGDEVQLHFTIPEANADGSRPPDVSRVDVYAVTTLPEDGGADLVLDEWLESAEPIFTFDVVVPVESEDPEEPEEPEEEVAGPRALGPGDPVTVVEVLTPDAVRPLRSEPDEEEEAAEAPDEDDAETAADGPVLAGPLVSPPLPRVPRRTYVAVAVSRRNRQSAAATAPPVAVQPAPEPPGRPVLTYTETSIDVEWTAPDTARLPLQAPPAADSGLPDSAAAEAEPAVLPAVTLLPPQTPSRYDVYDVSPPAEAVSEAGGEPAAGAGIPGPLNDQPLAATAYPGVEATLGVERCFLVRTVDTVDQIDRLALRSAASETTCVLLVDIFPPAPPTGLVAVAGGGAISLTWDANAEADVTGYLVLRGRAPDGALEALTPEPVTVTNYRDTAVEAGAGYVYAVRALDGADPPNLSPASEQVTEQAP